ncbi:MAG: AAA family ATPase [Candidatus Hinthialibacter sp.]
MFVQRITLHPELFPTEQYYPFNLDIFHQTSSLEFSAPTTFFVGENGSGKTTLLRAICQRCGIYIWGKAESSRAHRNPYENLLQKAVRVEWINGSVPGSYFGSDTFQKFASVVEDWADDDAGQLKYLGGKSLVRQSHGQSLMSYFTARYQIQGIYFLDEPETALSPASQIQLLQLIQQTTRDGHAQFIIATHSPILMACPDAQIYTFDKRPIQPIAYEDTVHYQIYLDFMNNRDAYLVD